MDDLLLGSFFLKRTALEIGGPSQLLHQYYPYLKNIDYLNNVSGMSSFAHTKISDDIYDCDATSDQIYTLLQNKIFDLLILSHTLEHIANPVKALKMWLKLLTKQGIIINIVPDKNYCWDRDREYTTFDHILQDYNSNIQENDMTHVHESSCMLETRPSYYEDVGTFNEKRIIHHHVFSKEVLKQIHEYAGYKTLFCENKKDDPLQLIYIGLKNE